MNGIAGKVVVITGASSGIGAATARLLAASGAKLVLGARRPEPLAALAGELDATWQATDVSRREDVAGLVALAGERYGRLDVLIGNAGAMPISPFDALRLADWEVMVDVNLKGVLYGIAAALPVFRAQAAGHFIHTASTSAHRIVPSQSVYAATKMAVRAISEGLRQEAGDSLRVTVISPGMTRTNAAAHLTDPAARAQIAAAQERIAMPADAVARAIAYAIAQPPDIDVGEIVIRPTAQA